MVGVFFFCDILICFPKMSTYCIELNASHVAALAALFASSSSSSPISLEAILCILARKRQLTIENGKPQPRLVRITVTGSSLSELLESFRVAVMTTTWPVPRELSGIADRLLLPPCLTEQRLVITDTTPRPRPWSKEWLRQEWIDWRHAHPPYNCQRWMVWHGFEWVNGPRYSYGRPEPTTTRFDSEFPPQHLWEQQFPGFRETTSTIPLLIMPPPDVLHESPDDDGDDQYSCVICFCARATVRVGCPAEHMVCCVGCMDRMRDRQMDFSRCPLCRFPLPAKPPN